MGEKKNWFDTLSETIDKATKAANEAWDGTADLRKEAWEKTKTAASSASDAMDQGVEQAKRSYQREEDSDRAESQGQGDLADDDPQEPEDSAESDTT